MARLIAVAGAALVGYGSLIFEPEVERGRPDLGDLDIQAGLLIFGGMLLIAGFVGAMPSGSDRA